MNWTDKLTRLATGLTVAGLALVAGAISFSHMSALAQTHDQVGWKASAFPISVDGLELISSLFILAQRRAGRRAGLLPWVALLVGTAASLAANVAVGGHDPVGRALAGWPAISLLVSIKMLFSMFDHDDKDDHRTVRDDHKTVRDDQRTVLDRTDVPGTGLGIVRADAGPSRTTTGPGTAESGTAAPGAPGAPGAVGVVSRTGTAGRGGGAHGVSDVAHLIPAARAARDALGAAGETLSRDRLASRMREDGHGLSNERGSLLLKILKAEENVTQLEPPAPDAPQTGNRAQAAS